jgi:hypothetical protein
MPVAYGAAANHCACYAGAHPIAVRRGELAASPALTGGLGAEALSSG